MVRVVEIGVLFVYFSCWEKVWVLGLGLDVVGILFFDCGDFVLVFVEVN